MKINFGDDGCVVIYLYHNIPSIDYKDEVDCEKFLKDLFVKLNNYYNYKIEGYYNVSVYIDDFYGIVLDLKREEFEYYDYFDNQVDMRISINKSHFLYLIDDYDFDTNKFDVYKFLNNIYLLPKEKLSDLEFAKLVENSFIIYDNEEIINRGILVTDIVKI